MSATAGADRLPALNLSGSLRLSKRAQVETQSHAGPIMLKSESALPGESASSPLSEPAASVSSSPASPPQPEARAQAVATLESDESAWSETSFIVPPGDFTPATSLSIGPISIRRKAKLTDVARIIAPAPPVEAEPSASKSGPSATVIPAAFSVAVATGSVIAPTSAENRESPNVSAAAAAMADPAKKEPAPAEIAPEKAPSAEADHGPRATEKIPAAAVAAPPVAGAAENPRSISPEAETTKAGPTLAPLSIESAGGSSGSPEKKEFLLTNGERILGRILSETAGTIYLDHGTLGVLTLPRAQIAQRPVEIILINGDRIVGDIMAETDDTLYVRHASLGMLTVPRAQRSSRVVEAILKDGDRILGEVLAETKSFTVIRSATLGTVTVPHDKVTMLNRKIEQIELKALPTGAPQLKDKAGE